MAEAAATRARTKEDLSNIWKRALKTAFEEQEMRGYKKTSPSVLWNDASEQYGVTYHLKYVSQAFKTVISFLVKRSHSSASKVSQVKFLCAEVLITQ